MNTQGKVMYYTVIGVDPGYTVGFTVFDFIKDDEFYLSKYGQIKKCDINFVVDFLEDNRSRIGKTLLCVENQYIPNINNRKQVNTNSIIKLIVNKSLWYHGCDLVYNVEKKETNPTTWQRKVLSVNNSMKSKQRKLKGILLNNSLFGTEFREHESDACCIARYCMTELGYKLRTDVGLVPIRKNYYKGCYERIR
jgi:hypothetical protein